MVFSCVFCEEEYAVMTYLCAKCRRLKHLKLTYGDRFNETIETVLVRNKEGQKNKEHQLISTEIKETEKFNMTLRSKDTKKSDP